MPARLSMRPTAVLRVLLAALLAATLLAFAPPADAMTRAQRQGVALDVVRNQKGDPYRYRAAGPDAFDCSA